MEPSAGSRGVVWWWIAVLGAGASGMGACASEVRHKLGQTCTETADCADGVCGGGVCLDPESDNDGDRLTNGFEAQIGSNPLNADSDEDGAQDGDELEQLNAVDIDGDGIPDVLESRIGDGDGDCLPDQYDPQNAIPNDDLTGLVPILCRTVGVCADVSALRVVCESGAGSARCDYVNVPEFEVVEARCDGRDNDCDGATDDGAFDLDDDGQADCVDADDDGDGVADDGDVCPVAPDPGQVDSDGDGHGDACDAPVPPVVTDVVPVSPAQSSTPTLVGIADPGALVVAFSDPACESEVGQGVVAADGTFAVVASVGRDGPHRHFLRAENAAMLRSACVPSGVAYVRDTVPPAPPSLTRVTPASPSADAEPLVEGMAELGATVTVTSVDKGLEFVATAGPTGTWSLRVELPGAGAWEFVATARDAAGNVSESAPLFTYTLATELPPAPHAAPVPFAPASPSNAAPEVMVSACAPAGTRVAFFVDACGAVPLAMAETSADVPCGDGTATFRVAAGLTLGRNVETGVYAQSLGLGALRSACVALGRFVHDDIAPVPPVVVLAEPSVPFAEGPARLVLDVERAGYVRILGGACDGSVLASGWTPSATLELVFAVPESATTATFGTVADIAGNVSTCSPLAVFTRTGGAVGCVDHDGDRYCQEEDCDDNDPRTHAGAAEICDHVDNDCDSATDEETVVIPWYVDADGDGYGDSGAGSVLACAPVAGRVLRLGDCDDAAADVFPGAPELCDRRDNDCSTGGIVEGREDADADGHAGVLASCVGGNLPRDDCDDARADVAPGMREICNGADDDCSGLADDADLGLDLASASTWYHDGDGDGAGAGGASVRACVAPEGYGTDTSDCRDDDAAVHPGADEVCDGADNDCDGMTDDADPGLLAAGALHFRDGDTDGFGTLAAWACADFGFGWTTVLGDCDDARVDVNPDASEVCDSRDNDCDGEADEASALDAATFFRDADGDSYGVDGDTVRACGQPGGYAARGGDCDDVRVAIHPEAIEVCNIRDDDCDGLTDVDTSGIPRWYHDGDGDTYGVDEVGTPACVAPEAGMVTRGGDCDDARTDVNPGATEILDPGAEVDNDCDGTLGVPAFVPGGFLDVDTTWGSAGAGGATVDLAGNLLVSAGVTLTILPCTHVRVGRGVVLEIDGALVARGTPECPVVFDSAAAVPAAGDWKGIFFAASATDGVLDPENDFAYVSGSVLEHVVVRDAGAGDRYADAAIRAADSGPALRGVVVRGSPSAGVRFTMSQYEHPTPRFLVGVDVVGGEYGIFADARYVTSYIVDAVIVGAQTGLYLYTNSDRGEFVRIEGGRFIGNARGVSLTLEWTNMLEPVFTLVGNQFVGNDMPLAGLVRYGGVAIATNSFYGNAGGEAGYGGLMGGSGAWIHYGDNLVQRGFESPGISAGFRLPGRESLPLTVSLAGNNFVAEQEARYFLHAGAAAGGGVIDARDNYWAGLSPAAAADVVYDFRFDASLMPVNVTRVLAEPNPAAPIGVPAGLAVTEVGGNFVVSWDENAESDHAGYRLYYGLEEDWELHGVGAVEGASGFDAGGATEVTLHGLDPALPWYFSVTAYDAEADGARDLVEGHESWFAARVTVNGADFVWP